MNIIKTIGSIGLATLVVSAFGQSNPPRFFELHQEPPVEVQRSFSLGQKSDSDLLHLTVSLPFGDPKGIQKYADAVSDPKNPLYRHFITPEEVGRRFGLPAYRVERVRQYLAAQGMNIKLVAKNHLAILAEGSVAQAQSAFHTSIQNFGALSGRSGEAEMRFAFTTPPSLPADIAGDVLNIDGLENFTRPVSHTALTATQLRSLYSAATIYGAGGKEGAGRTIAISSFDGYRLTNVPLEVSLMSLPTPSGGAGSNITVEAIGGGAGNTGTAAGEGDLDIQCVLCMAPLANIIIYDNDASAGFNPLAVYTQEVNDNTADIITESYGWSLTVAQALSAHNLHLSMTTQGITYMAAAGDHGTTWVSSGSDFDYPATDPEVLSVGGTSATVNSSGARLTEVGWNSSGDSGGGGWNVTTDTFNTRPTYQSTTTFLAGAGVPSLTSVPYRLVPDVSFDADPNTGYLIYYSGAEAQYGGTSAASPTCAGLLAELEEQLITDGALTANSSGKYRLGRVQDLLYSYNGMSSVFYDITSGTNGTLPNGVVSNAGPGWDTDSGWGPIIFSGLQAQIEKGVASVTLSPTSVAGGAASTGTVTLQVAAPTGGSVVTLASSSSSATVPASVTVAAGSTTATFAVSTTSVTAATSSTITATYNSSSKTASLAITVPVTVSKIALSPTSVAGGASSTGTVTLSAAAPTGGSVVSLSSSNTSATVPASVTVAAGATTATFTVTTTAVSAATSATLTATLGSSSATASLAITAPTVSSVTLSPASVAGGASSTGTVTLSSAAPASGIVVTMTSSNASATVPASVTVTSGSKTATFSIATTAVATATSSTISATYGTSSSTASLAITAPTVSSVTVSPTSVLGGSTSTGSVTISSIAPTGGLVVSLKSSSTSATVPASVTIAAGAKTGTFTVTTVAVSANASATITATIGSASVTSTLTMTAATVSSLALSSSTVVGGCNVTITGTVTLSSPAGPSGNVVTLKSSSTSAATVAASVTVPAGATTATFTVTHLVVTTSTSTTITATSNSTSKTAALAVTPFTVVSVSLSPSTLVGGAATTVTVTLNAVPKSSAVTVTLSSSSTSSTVPASISVAIGSSTGTASITTKAVTTAATSTITAKVGSSSSTATLTIQV